MLLTSREHPLSLTLCEWHGESCKGQLDATAEFSLLKVCLFFIIFKKFFFPKVFLNSLVKI